MMMKFYIINLHFILFSDTERGYIHFQHRERILFLRTRNRMLQMFIVFRFDIYYGRIDVHALASLNQDRLNHFHIISNAWRNSSWLFSQPKLPSSPSAQPTTTSTRHQHKNRHNSSTSAHITLLSHWMNFLFITRMIRRKTIICD